ncbi:MAG: UbiA family prenyltransferase [Kiritimatiellaeota bacterium]|nr:UbiA family prenyltransferase [Kiritimatiellota bacterium]
MNEKIGHTGIAGWLALFRFPNIFTIPGDVVAGYLIAESTMGKIDRVLGYSFTKREFADLAFFPALATVLALYCYGLILNDLVDFKEDSLERPDRPLPSRAVSIGSAKLAVGLLLSYGLIMALSVNRHLFVLACSLAAVITGYDVYLKRLPLAGPAALATCRTMALIAGFLACGIEFNIANPAPFLTIACATWWIYIFAVSVTARRETRPKEMSGFERKVVVSIPYLQLFWIFAAMFVGGGVAAVEAAGEHPPGFLLALALAIAFTLSTTRSVLVLVSDNATATATAAQESVGALIRGIVFLQASACAFLGYPYAALCVAALWIPATFAAMRYKSS